MTGHHEDFDAFLKSKEVEAWLSEIPRESTRNAYSTALFRYWRESISKHYPTLQDWVFDVKKERKSEDMVLRKKWALDLLKYMNSRVSPKGRKMGFSDRQILVAAVLGFLRALVDEDISYNFKLQPSAEELDRKNKPAMREDEVRKLYDAAQSSRDKALVLCAVNGIAPAEMVQLTKTWKNWFPKDLSKLSAPFRVNLVREKANFPYHVTLWQDAAEALRTLYAERMRETGGQMAELFVTEKGESFTRTAYDQVMVRLRERAGLYEPGKPYEAQRVHAHGFRHFFKTRAKLHGVNKDVTEFCLGHSGDSYGYDKSHLEPEWCEIVERELQKMTDLLNLKTGMAQAYYQSKEEQIAAEAAKDTYKTLIEAGVLKPENLSQQVLKIIAEKVGVKFENLVLAGYDSEEAQERGERLELFEAIADAVDLSNDTYYKYMEALKVMKPTAAKSAWENDDWYWMRVEVGSDEYMQALADHFEVVDKDDKMRILRKPKPLSPAPIDVENTKTGVASQQ